MKYVGQLHSQYMNRKYRRTGGLWEGRFRSSVVQSESYLLACYRYIELRLASQTCSGRVPMQSSPAADCRMQSSRKSGSR